MRTSRPVLAAAAALAVLAVLGCGSSSSSGSGASTGGSSGTAASGGGSAPAAVNTAATTGSAARAATSKLRLSADPGGALRFNRSKLTAKAGRVTITMANPSSSGIPHAVAVEGHGVDRDGPTAGPGRTSTVSVRLKPGTYTFYCPVDGHRQAGMRGTLVVR
ncbi:MAG TPA: cupredoxin domain-containing protein [Baekduia sp.]|nr:cupredoxin domain-containing protein [Baekduia sp.]